MSEKICIECGHRVCGCGVCKADQLSGGCGRCGACFAYAMKALDEARSLLIEEQQARHAAGTRVAQLDGLLREAQGWVEEVPGVTFAGAADDLRDRITAALTPLSPDDALALAKFFDVVKTETLAAISERMHVPPSPAGASAPASGSTTAASSATSSGSEVEGSRCGQSGIDEVVQVVRDGVVYSATTARVLLDRIADPKMNDRPAVHVFDADVKGGE